MKKIFVFLFACPLLLILLFFTACLGQSNSVASKNNNGEKTAAPNYGTQIGNYIVNIFEDSKGNMWFGTMEYGVARYTPSAALSGDESAGKAKDVLTYFTKLDGLCGNTIPSMAEDKEGNIWFGSHTGLCKYNPSNDEAKDKGFTTVKATTGLHDQGEGWMSVRTDQAGNIWTSSSLGVFYADANTPIEEWSNFSPFKLPINKEEITTYAITPGRASLALEDRKGNLWFRTDGAGAFKYNPSAAAKGENAFTQFTQEDGLWSNNITSILEDKNGHIWFTCMQSYQPEMTDDGGVVLYDGKTFRKFPALEGMSNNDIYTIYEDRSENIWIGATGFGVYRFDLSSDQMAGEKYDYYEETDRMDLTRGLGLQEIYEDSRGIIWMGFSGGLFRFTGNSIINVTQNGPWE